MLSPLEQASFRNSLSLSLLPFLVGSALRSDRPSPAIDGLFNQKIELVQCTECYLGASYIRAECSAPVTMKASTPDFSAQWPILVWTQTATNGRVGCSIRIEEEEEEEQFLRGRNNPKC